MTKYLRTRMSDFLSRKTRQTTIFFSRLNHWYLIINCCQIDVQILNRSKIVKLFSKRHLSILSNKQCDNKNFKNGWRMNGFVMLQKFKKPLKWWHAQMVITEEREERLLQKKNMTYFTPERRSIVTSEKNGKMQFKLK